MSHYQGSLDSYLFVTQPGIGPMALNIREVLCPFGTLFDFDLFIQPILTSQITILLPLRRVLTLQAGTATLCFNSFCLLFVFIYLRCWGLNPWHITDEFHLNPQVHGFQQHVRVRSFPWDTVKYKRSALLWTRTKAICLCFGTLFSFLSDWTIVQSNKTLKKQNCIYLCGCMLYRHQWEHGGQRMIGANWGSPSFLRVLDINCRLSGPATR